MNYESRIMNYAKINAIIRNSSFIIHPRKGFTLIELLVAVSIIGMLASFIAVSFVGVREKARDSERKSDLSLIQAPLQTYFEDHGQFPLSSLDFKIKDGETIVSWGGSWNPYMSRVPKDPNPNLNYCYESSDGSWYRLCAKLEHCPDPQSIPGVVCASALYNYSVTSSNIPAGPCGCGQ